MTQASLDLAKTSANEAEPSICDLELRDPAALEQHELGLKLNHVAGNAVKRNRITRRIQCTGGGSEPT